MCIIHNDFSSLRLKLFGNKFSIIFVVFLVITSCSGKNLYKDKEYNYIHYPNSYQVPNSRYYGKPYELTPKKNYPYTDFDHYYVLPYGYDKMESGSDAFLKS